ncbi:hypothetical protein [Salinigranum sp. GCM10025319]|uniref:hypothetical protein n=1 Tax=Salinigranum sp. GCM10025319 TaxID=3252687 RepID=UPI0036190F83
MANLGPVEKIPSWAVLLILLATTFYVLREEPLPSTYGLFGVSVPVQGIVALVVVLLTVAAVYNETYPFLLQYFERK